MLFYESFSNQCQLYKYGALTTCATGEYNQCQLACNHMYNYFGIAWLQSSHKKKQIFGPKCVYTFSFSCIHSEKRKNLDVGPGMRHVQWSPNMVVSSKVMLCSSMQHNEVKWSLVVHSGRLNECAHWIWRNAQWVTHPQIDVYPHWRGCTAKTISAKPQSSCFYSFILATFKNHPSGRWCTWICHYISKYHLVGSDILQWTACSCGPRILDHSSLSASNHGNAFSNGGISCFWKLSMMFVFQTLNSASRLLRLSFSQSIVLSKSACNSCEKHIHRKPQWQILKNNNSMNLPGNSFYTLFTALKWRLIK